LRAKARVDCARGPSLPGIERKTLARNRFDRRCHSAIRIAGGDTDGLAAEVKAEQHASIG
jgi:hypothetical protein